VLECRVRHEAAGRLDAAAATSSESVAWCDRQLAVFAWLHPEVDVARMADAQDQVGRSSSNSHGSLPEAVAALHTSAQRVTALLPVLRQAHEQFATSEQAVTQRLAWAGAHRQHAGGAAAFSAAAAARTQSTLAFAKMCNMLSGLANALSHFETYRVHAADMARLDTATADALRALRAAATAIDDCASRQAAVEAVLPAALKVMAPQGRITAPWLAAAVAQLPAQHAEARAAVAATQVAAAAQLQRFDGPAAALDHARAATATLMAELDPLMAPLVRAGARMPSAVSTWHSALDAALIGAAACCRSVAAAPSDAVVAIALDHDAIDLAALGAQLVEGVAALSAADDEPLAAIADDARPAVAEQERNAQATTVWRRVRAKLEGRDGDGGRRSVGEQVDALVKDATADARLCMMYEGWAPWI
jgi:hypothetical protein